MRRYLLDLMKEDFIVSQCTPVAVPIPVPFPDSGSLIPNDYFSMRFQSQGCDVLERFSNDCRKTKTKAITPTNHNRNKRRDEPITIPSNFL